MISTRRPFGEKREGMDSSAKTPLEAVAKDSARDDAESKSKPSPLADKRMWAGVLGLSFCLIARDVPQFLGLSSIEGNALTQYALAAGRAFPLAIAIVLFIVARRRHATLAISARGFVLVALAAALSQTVGLSLLIMAHSVLRTTAGCLALGVGQSLLVMAWAVWLLRQAPESFLKAAGASFIAAGALEMILALMTQQPAVVLSLCAPFASCLLGAAAASGNAFPPRKTYHRAARLKADARLVLCLVMLCACSFIARELTDTWMAHSTADTLMMFELFGGAGTALTAVLAYATARMGHDQRNSGAYLLLAFPLIIAATYLSSTLAGSMSAIYLIPLFAIRKSLLLFSLLCCVRYASGRDRVLCFVTAMLCVEVGNLIQTACAGLLEALPLSTDIAQSVVFTLVLVLMFVLPLVILLPQKGPSPEDNTREQARLNRLREQAISEIAREHGLTKRETEVLGYLDAGRNAEYIAKKLYIAHSTAKSHIAHIYQKTNMNSQQRLMDAIEERAQKIEQDESEHAAE